MQSKLLIKFIPTNYTRTGWCMNSCRAFLTLGRPYVTLTASVKWMSGWLTAPPPPQMERGHGCNRGGLLHPPPLAAGTRWRRESHHQIPLWRSCISQLAAARQCRHAIQIAHAEMRRCKWASRFFNQVPQTSEVPVSCTR